MEVLPLTPDRFDALASLFNEGGDPRWCWCLYWRVRGRDWEQGSPRRNRDRLRSLAENAPAPGLVAVRDGVAIGWVGLGPRTDFERLERSRVIPKIDGRSVWSIVCFVVSKGARGEGIARALLNAAVDYARANGAPAVEAYPTDTGGERLTAAAAYTGTLAMFESAGFKIASTTSSVSGGRPRVIVRRRLRPSR